MSKFSAIAAISTIVNALTWTSGRMRFMVRITSR
jgi:hypothetical protein